MSSGYEGTVKNAHAIYMGYMQFPFIGTVRVPIVIHLLLYALYKHCAQHVDVVQGGV